MEKDENRYMIPLLMALQKAFDEDSESYIWELEDEDLNDFFYTLIVMLPQFFYWEITWEKVDPIALISIATRLAFQQNIINNKQENETNLN